MIRLCYSNRTEALLDALAEDLSGARDPFTPTPLVIPNPQVEAYVKMGLAQRLGIAANIEARYLRGFLADVAAASAPDVVIVDRASIQGELLALFHDQRRLAPRDLGAVRDYLAAGADTPDGADLRRFQFSAALAALFDDYSYSRPEMLQAWREGRLAEVATDNDPERRELQTWQRALWLALFGRRGAFEERGRADGRRYLTAPAFFEACAPQTLQTPRTTYVFGISYVARLYRRVFAGLGQAGAVQIYALNPCREFWEDLETGRGRRGREAERARFPPRRGGEQLSLLGTSAGPTLFGAADGESETPALALWARPGRENIRLLNQLSECDFASRFRDPLADGPAPTLLTQLQHDILDRVPARRGRERLALADDSIALLPCPDPRRELETIAAEIWALVAADEERRAATGEAGTPLRFTDIAVVVPASAAETYLPLAAAVFSEASELPHTIIDGAAGAGSRVDEAVALLLALPLGPLGRQDLLRLAAHPAVAARFPDADPDDWLALCDALQIVHGADRQDHAGTYVDGDRFNWDQGLRRLALGAFLAGRRSGEERPFTFGDSRYLPAELAAERQESAQGFAILARALIAFAVRARDTRQTVAEWMAQLRRAIATTVLPATPADEAALTRVFVELQRVEAAAPPDLRVGYRIACELVRAALAARPARAGRYLTEGVTVSTFLPMRAVPFRAVFVAGMGEGRFPAADRADELDLRAGKRLPGDVSAREQDQYMFLETLLCARERLYLSYVDRDQVTGERLGPCSTVLELQEMLADGYLAAGAGAPRTLARAAPPLRRHQDPAACAVIPAAARERRAAALGASLRAAVARDALPEWPELRRCLAPEALSALAPAVAWVSPPAGAAPLLEEAGRRVITLRQLLRFLECPLQGSARAHLPLGDDGADEEAEAAYREHEDFETSRLDTGTLLRRVLADALGADAHGGPAALAHAYDAAAEMAALDGTLPVGAFAAAARERHLELLRAWRDGLALAVDEGAALVSDGAPAPLWFGQAPEHQRNVEIQPPVTLQVTVPGVQGPRALRVDIHGATQPTALVGGVPATLLLLTTTTKSSGNGRDLLRGWIDHLVLCAAGMGTPEGRRVLIVRPDLKGPEERRLAPLSAEAARGYLTQLATDLLSSVYPYFLPCEAVLGWVKKEPRPALTDYILMLREDEWTRFTSDWGPVPAARWYDPPPEEEAQAIVGRRFQPLFDAELSVEGRGKKVRR